MSHILSLVNKASQKVTGQRSDSLKRDERRERVTDAWLPIRVHDDPMEEKEVPLKQKKTAPLDKGKHVQVQTLALPWETSSADDGLFQLPKVWFESGGFGSQASLYLSDPELKVIRDLGVASRTRAVTDGVIGAINAMEVSVYMNNSFTEETVRSDALTWEKEVMAKRMAELEAELAAAKKSALEKDKMFAFLEDKADSANRYYHELKEVRAKFDVEKKALEDALCDYLPGEDETEDTAVLARPALVYRIEELERNLVSAARHGFDIAVDQLNVVNPGVEFRVDGIYFFKYVENGKIVSSQNDDGHV
jgi:hypothetical protein